MAAIRFVCIGLLLLVFRSLEDLNHGSAGAAHAGKEKSKAQKEQQLIETYYVEDADIEKAFKDNNWTSPIAPPPLFIPLTTIKGRKQAITLKNLLAQDAQRNPDKYDPRDVENVVNGSLWHVTRFMGPKDVDADRGYSSEFILLKDSWARMETNLMWRNTMAINEDNPTAVWPCEFCIIHVTVPRQGGLPRRWVTRRSLAASGSASFSGNLIGLTGGRDGTAGR